MDHPSAPGEPAWIAADRKPLHPLCPDSPRMPNVRRSPARSRRLPAARSLAHRRRGPLPMPGRPLRGAGPDLHAHRRKGSAPVLPSHLHWDSDPISTYAQELGILITPNWPEVMFSRAHPRRFGLPDTDTSEPGFDSLAGSHNCPRRAGAACRPLPAMGVQVRVRRAPCRPRQTGRSRSGPPTVLGLVRDPWGGFS